MNRLANLDNVSYESDLTDRIYNFNELDTYNN